MTTSTPTAADALLERKKILEGNTLLIHDRDTYLREIAQWQPVLHAIRAEVAAHLDLPELTQNLNGMLSTKLMEQRDQLQREIDEKTATSTSLDAQNAAKAAKGAQVQKDIDSAEERLSELKKHVEKHESLAVEAQSEHTTAVTKAQDEIAVVNGELSQARSHLTSVKLEEEVLLQNRQAEDIRLANKGRDLAIYESRIRTAAAQMDPPMQIHV